ncbi:MAG: chorismate synthase [Spirochaetaceae bacterium]
MPGSNYGTIFKITTFGESHGEALGVVIDGVPAGFELSLDLIQEDMDRRRPGQSDVTTPRKEADKIKCLSGFFQGKTTGTPLTLILFNENTKSKDYGDIVEKFRPGHGDWTYFSKYNGHRDWRGGGRSSGRETSTRVAAGSVAKQLLKTLDVDIHAYTKAAGGIKCQTYNREEIEKNSMRACDPIAAEKMVAKVKTLMKEHDSMGGIVECKITNIPPGIGEPVFNKLDAELAKVIMSIGTVKGFEIGSGFACAEMTGKQQNDERNKDGFLSNNAGGIIAGISTGQDIVFRAAIKPTPSISQKQQTVDKNNNDTEIVTIGRHDPCICPRVVPVIEAMAAIAILDLLLVQKRNEFIK